LAGKNKAHGKKRKMVQNRWGNPRKGGRRSGPEAGKMAKGPLGSKTRPRNGESKKGRKNTNQDVRQGAAKF